MSIRFTDLPTGGVLYLRPHGKIWVNDAVDRTSVDRNDDDVRVAKNMVIALADLDRLVFIPDQDVNGVLTLNYQVYDGQAWSTGEAQLRIGIASVNDLPAQTRTAEAVSVAERDQDFGATTSADNPDSSDVAQPLSEYGLHVGQFTALVSGDPDSTLIYFDATALAASTNGRVEIYDVASREWGAPGTAGQFTLGQLRGGHVRLRFDTADNADAVLAFARTFRWGEVSGTYDQTITLVPQHIAVLTNAHFGHIADVDKEHDAPDRHHRNAAVDPLVQFRSGTLLPI